LYKKITSTYFASQLLLLALTSNTLAKDYFNSALLELSGFVVIPADLSAFEQAGGQMTGIYRVDILFNHEKVDTRDVEFRLMPDAYGKYVLQPCFPIDDLINWGVLVKKYPELNLTGNDCANLAAIPQSSSRFDFAKQRLSLTFPQSSVNNSARGYGTTAFPHSC
jgi:outer membrane usher protein